MTVYRKEDMYPTTMKLDSPNSSILSSYFHRRYIVLYISQISQKFIQVSSYDNSNAFTIAAIDSQVLAYEVLDLYDDKNLFFVYAIKTSSGKDRQLVQLAIR